MLSSTSIVATVLFLSAAAAQVNTTTQNATVFSLEYGYPLLAFEKLASGLINTIGVNQIRHGRTLSTAKDTAVVKPNVDTLYSQAIFDLSHSDLVITIPDIPNDQFALFSYYDAYGNNFANTGTGNLALAGEYSLTAASSNGTTGQDVGLHNGASSRYEARVVSPSLYGIILIRWLVNATNLDAVHGHQDAFALHNVTRSGNAVAGPYLSGLADPDSSLSAAQNVLNLLAQMAAYTGPRVSTEYDIVDSALEAAGISSGVYTAPADVNLDAANKTALASALLASSAIQTKLNNGWTMSAENKTGDFGTDYALRAYVAASGYLQLKAPNAIYPSWSNASEGPASGNGGLSIGANECIIYTFSAKPPLAETGFWSLTAYNAENYLVGNKLNVYALGDRSNITYPSGVRVYGANVSSTMDGKFQILLQPADVVPPANWTSNWLPAPSGGGNLSVLLRWYGAEAELLDGRYQYPVVSRQLALRAANGSVNGTTTSGSPPAVQTGHGVSSYFITPLLSALAASTMAMALLA